jgi:DNA-binding CsgD family transcriptional regulator
MQHLIPSSFQELFEQAGNYYSFPKPSADALLRNMGYNAASLNAQAPIFYAGDYTQGKYLYLDPSCELLLGYNKEYIAGAGQHFYNSIIHPSDYAIFNKHIFPNSIRFLQDQPHEERLKYSCSYNYRVKIRSGHYITVLQRATFFLHPDTHVPLASVGFIIDITHFKEGSKMIHTIERIDRGFSVLSAEPVYKAAYYPDKEDALLSKREVEILQLICSGLPSKRIAEKLCVSINTINNHRKNILRKTQSATVAELVNYGVKNQLL